MKKGTKKNTNIYLNNVKNNLKKSDIKRKNSNGIKNVQKTKPPNFIERLSEKNMNQNIETICNKIDEIKANFLSNIIINVKETNKNFNDFLDNISTSFLEEDINSELPNIPEIYSKKNKLGLHKNNKDDYFERLKLIIDIEVIEEELEYDIPIKETKIIINDNNSDKNINNIQIAINKDENILENNFVKDDINEIKIKMYYINKILEIWKENRVKQKLYVGLEKNSKDVIFRIYGKIFDKERKIKVLEFNRISMKFDLRIKLEKSVKELFNVDSLSKEELISRIDEAINQFNKCNNL